MRAMARSGRRQARAGRTEGGRRRLSDARRIDARRQNCRSRICWPSATARSARRSIPTLLARLDLKLGDRVTHRQRDLPDPQRGLRRAGQARRQCRARSALPRQRSGPARHRPAAARQPGALDLPRQTAGQCRRRSCRDGTSSTDARARIAGSRLGNPQPRQRLAAARAHHQPLHPVPDAGRPCRAPGRRRRRRQRREEPYRSPPRRHRDLQGGRRHRPRRLHDLSHAGDRACRARLRDRARRRRGIAVRDRRRCSARSCRCRWCRRCISTSSRCPSSMACSPRWPSGCGRSAGCTTCRSRRCSAKTVASDMAPAALALSRADGASVIAATGRGRDRPCL